MDVRVRLEFADDVGRHVLRRRGFSSCWYLVPKDVKLVGDLAHALQREFGLRQRCPQGLELRLEELPLLATQSIRIVRDNDTIVVQCPVVEDALGTSETSESEEERADVKRRKRKQRGKEEQPKKKIKGTLSRQTAQRTSPSLVQKSQSGKVESSSSSSSSSDSESSSESSSSSSSSDSEDDSVSQQRKTRQTAVKREQLGKSDGVGSTPNGVASKPNGSEQTGKDPRRRRRRLRQRNGRRQRNGNQEPSAAENAAEQIPQSGSNGSAVRSQDSSVPARYSTSSRGYPRNKGHVLFDEETGNQVIVHHDDDKSDARENNSNRTAQRTKTPELAKYGPSSPSHQQSNPSRDIPADVVLNRGKDINSYDATSKPKGKGKYEERWKRPYEIVATVMDKTSKKTNKPDLTASLSSYPTGSASSVDAKDIIAFKTLTLCLETWQPKLSEWQCGQVQSVDATSSSIEVSKWILNGIGDSVEFSEAPQSEQQIVPISEISELCFLSGPSHSSLQKAGN